MYYHTQVSYTLYTTIKMGRVVDSHGDGGVGVEGEGVKGEGVEGEGVKGVGGDAYGDGGEDETESDGVEEGGDGGTPVARLDGGGRVGGTGGETEGLCDVGDGCELDRWPHVDLQQRPFGCAASCALVAARRGEERAGLVVRTPQSRRWHHWKQLVGLPVKHVQQSHDWSG